MKNWNFIKMVGSWLPGGDRLGKVAERFVESESRRRLWAERTLENYEVLLGHYREYSGDAKIGEVNVLWTDGFMEYLCGEKGLRNSTVLMLMQQHKAVMRWAHSEGYAVRQDVLKYAPRLRNVNHGKNVVALTREELHRMLSVDIGSKAMREARDVFCFCCLTSLRYSDVRRLRWENIGDGWMEIVTRKTNEHLHIPLSGAAYNILIRYKGNGSALPVVSCVNYNRNLKSVARMAGLDRPVNRTWYVGGERHEECRPLHEVISSHMGRKTFVTMALSAGMPVEVLCAFTGHRDSSQLKHYYDITREEQRRWSVTLGLQV